MENPAFIRLAQASADTSRELDAAEGGEFGKQISFKCAQVPKTFGIGSPVWIWLGSDNNKGAKTEWKQGVRALAVCSGRQPVEGKQTRITLDQVFVLPDSVSKKELLRVDPDFYSDELSDAAIVGLNNYASQVVQVLSRRQFWAIGQAIAELNPLAADELRPLVESLIGKPEKSTGSSTADLDDEMEAEEEGEEQDEPLVSEVEDDDPVLREVLALLDENNCGGILFVGSPGTGKSWYARHIGIHLSEGDRSRFREIQFHQAYQYEDFVEGYVPTEASGFDLRPKHLLQMADEAMKSDLIHVLVIDEFSRTDPARVMGEAMTYIDPPMRGKEFSLRSGNTARIPKNLVLFATMNPEDRSVDEIDDAMDRRWAKVRLIPDGNQVRKFLVSSNMPGPAIGPILAFFDGLQKHMAIGHAYFRSVGSAEALGRLWTNQIEPLVEKRFRFDQTSRDAVQALWEICRTEAAAATAMAGTAPASAAHEATSEGPGPDAEPA